MPLTAILNYEIQFHYIKEIQKTGLTTLFSLVIQHDDNYYTEGTPIIFFIVYETILF